MPTTARRKRITELAALFKSANDIPPLLGITANSWSPDQARRWAQLDVPIVTYKVFNRKSEYEFWSA
jgi:hypothetical protein